MLARLIFSLGVLMLLISVGAGLFFLEANSVELAAEKKVSDISVSDNPVVAIEREPQAFGQQDQFSISGPENQPETVSTQTFSASAEIDLGELLEVEAPAVSISNENINEEVHPARVASATQNVSEAVTLMEMVERCHNSIWEFAPVNAVGLKNTGDSFQWNNPKPFTGLGLSSPDGRVTISYLNMKGDTPSGNRRTCRVMSDNIVRLGLESFYPEFSSWWKAQFDLSDFESLPISQNAYQNDNDIIHQWLSRGANARGCAINVTYVERHESDFVELTVIFYESEEHCAAAGTNLVRVNRLPQISSD